MWHPNTGLFNQVFPIIINCKRQRQQGNSKQNIEIMLGMEQTRRKEVEHFEKCPGSLAVLDNSCREAHMRSLHALTLSNKLPGLNVYTLQQI